MYDVRGKIIEKLGKAGIDHKKISIITTPLKQIWGTKIRENVEYPQYHSVEIHSPMQPKKEILTIIENIEFDKFVLTKPDHIGKTTEEGFKHISRYQVRFKDGISAIIDIEEEKLKKISNDIPDIPVLKINKIIPEFQEEKDEKKSQKKKKVKEA